MDCSYLFIIHNYLPISLLFPDISPLNFTCFSFVGDISKPLTISPSQFGWCFSLQIFEDCAGLHPLSVPLGNDSSLHEGSCPGKKIYSLYVVSHWLGFTIELPHPGRNPACGPRCDFRPLSTVTLQRDFSAGDGVPG